MAPSAMLGPVIGLNLWTFFMEGWMYKTRIQALSGKKVDRTMTKPQFDALIPPRARWKADNYNNLMEQPTQFYAIALTLALMGRHNKTDLALAWAYVGIRVVHSLVQSSENNIPVRFSVFLTSGVVLLGMTVRTAIAFVSEMP